MPILRYFSDGNFVTDIGTEELAHLEMVATIVHQLTKNLSMEEIENSGFANYYVDHTVGIWPQAAGGVPFNACEFQSKGDIITDLMEDMTSTLAIPVSTATALHKVIIIKIWYEMTPESNLRGVTCKNQFSLCYYLYIPVWHFSHLSAIHIINPVF